MRFASTVAFIPLQQQVEPTLQYASANVAAGTTVQTPANPAAGYYYEYHNIVFWAQTTTYGAGMRVNVNNVNATAIIQGFSQTTGISLNWTGLLNIPFGLQAVNNSAVGAVFYVIFRTVPLPF